MFKYFIGLLFFILVSCSNTTASQKQTETGNSTETENSTETDDATKTETSKEIEELQGYSSWSFQNNSLSDISPQWDSSPATTYSYSYEPEVAGLTIDSQGKLAFDNLASFASAGGQNITVTAANGNTSKSIKVELKVIAQNKEDLERLIQVFIDDADIGLMGNYNAIDTGKVVDMSHLFDGAQDEKFQNFNGNISGWDTSKVTDMNRMFASTFKFNRDLNSWNTENVENMERMFNSATVFDGKIGNWNTKKVKNMQSMFYNAKQFNQDISGWITGEVTDMGWMFNSAKKFNQDISGWNISKVKRDFPFLGMFNGATAFNRAHNNGNRTDPNSYFGS